MIGLGGEKDYALLLRLGGACPRVLEGGEFEVDALMVEPVGGVMAAMVFEMKAVFLGEGEILDDVTEGFVGELIKTYGRDKGGKERDKGVAQLARIVGAIVRREWAGEKGEIVGASIVLPVLLVHDTRLDSPGTCAILNDHFKELLGTVMTDARVASLIVLTVEDLENLESSVGRFSLAELLWDYHQECQDRLVSLRHFLVGSKYSDLIRPSDSPDVAIEPADGGGQPSAVSRSGRRQRHGLSHLSLTNASASSCPYPNFRTQWALPIGFSRCHSRCRRPSDALGRSCC